MGTEEIGVEALKEKINLHHYRIEGLERTLREISETLKELKTAQQMFLEYKQDVTLIRRDISDMQKLIDKLFVYHDDNVRAIKAIEINAATHTTSSNLKLGIGERLIWLIISAAIAGWSIFKGQ